MPHFPHCKALNVGGEQCSNIAHDGLAVCHIHNPARQCGYAQPDGTACRTATGGKGYCRRHDGSPQPPMPKPKPARAPKPPRPQSESSKAFYRRQEEAFKGEMEIANTIWRWRNPEEAHRLELERGEEAAWPPAERA